MKNLWNWLSGKKTIFGLVALQASELVDEPTVKGILHILGLVLTGVGVGHKVVK